MFNTGTCGDNRWPRWAQRAGLRGYTQRDFFLTSYLQSSNTVIFRNLSGTKSCNGTRYSLSVQLRSHQVGRGDNRATLNPIEVTKKSSYFHEKKEIMTQNGIGGFFYQYEAEWFFFTIKRVCCHTCLAHALVSPTWTCIIQTYPHACKFYAFFYYMQGFKWSNLAYCMVQSQTDYMKYWLARVVIMLLKSVWLYTLFK